MTTIQPETKARILRAAADAKYPREALPTIASHHHLTIDEVREVVHAHGWPRAESMRRAAVSLDELAARDATPAPTETADAGGEVTVPIAQVQPDPDNVREDVGDLSELVDSLVQVGMLQPIVVRRDGKQLVVVAGHRRLRAAQQLGWTRVPVVLRDIAPADVLVAMLHENGQRRDLDPIEEARAYAALKARDDLTDMQAARRLGRAQSHVSARLALLDLSPEDQAAVRSGTLSITVGTQRGRKVSGKARASHQGKASAAHLAFDHPLAPSAETLCRQLEHSKHTAGRVGNVACGSCWEAVIRSDERMKLERHRRRTTAEVDA